MLKKSSISPLKPITPSKPYLDPLVDRNCAMLDGWCDCKTSLDCVYSRPQPADISDLKFVVDKEE